MEKDKMSERESLELITEMIRNARQRMKTRIHPNVLLICGYASLIVALLIWVIRQYSSFYYVSFIWLLIPLICMPVCIRLNTEKGGYTGGYIDRVVNRISVIIAVLCVTAGLSTLWVTFPVFFVEGLLISLWVVVIGLLIDYKFVVYGGIAGLLVAHSLLFLQDDIWQIPLFACIVLMSILIPGHLLKNKSN